MFKLWARDIYLGIVSPLCWNDKDSFLHKVVALLQQSQYNRHDRDDLGQLLFEVVTIFKQQ